MEHAVKLELLNKCECYTGCFAVAFRHCATPPSSPPSLALPSLSWHTGSVPAVNKRPVCFWLKGREYSDVMLGKSASHIWATHLLTGSGKKWTLMGTSFSNLNETFGRSDEISDVVLGNLSENPVAITKIVGESKSCFCLPFGKNVCDLQLRLCEDILEKFVEILSPSVILARRDFHIPQWLFSLFSILSPLIQLTLITLYDQRTCKTTVLHLITVSFYMIATKLSKKRAIPKMYIQNWVQLSSGSRHKR